MYWAKSYFEESKRVMGHAAAPHTGQGIWPSAYKDIGPQQRPFAADVKQASIACVEFMLEIGQFLPVLSLEY